MRRARYLIRGQPLSAYLGFEAVTSLFLSKLRSPVTSSLDGGILVLLPSCCDVVGERVVWIWCAEESLDGEEDGANLQGWGPVALQDVQANAAELVDVGVVDLGEEADFGRRHGVVVGKEQLELECAALVW